jgi:16S rRNA (cytosine967-C5)-methyltransferase
MRPPRPAATSTVAHAAPGLAARRVAVELVERALAGKALDAALDAEAGHAGLAALPERDRALARAIVGAALRRHGQIADALGRLIARPLPEKATHLEAVLTVGAAQILFLDVPDHAAVSLAVTLARGDRRSARWAALVNGVLRRLARERAAILADQDPAALALPAWLAARWRKIYGDDATRRTAQAILVEPALDLSVKADPAGWAERLGGIALPTGSVRLVPHGPVDRLPGFAEGAWWVQDAAAALPARLLGDVAGVRVLDLCAAPGGKTAALAAAGARVTAVDVSALRLRRLEANLARLGLSAEIVVADLLEWQPAEAFPAILLDAPCTATGTLRRHPDAGFAKRPEDVAALAGLQARLLARAAGWLAPGGTLVFSTCSLEPEEGPDQVERLLATSAPLARAPIAAAEIGGLAEAITPAGDLRTLPFHLANADPRLAGLDGFYAARLVRAA